MKKLSKKQMLNLIQLALNNRDESQPIKPEEQLAILDVLNSHDEQEYMRDEQLERSIAISQRARVPFITDMVSRQQEMDDPVTITLGNKDTIFNIDSPFGLVSDIYNPNNNVCKTEFDINEDRKELQVRVDSLSSIFNDRVSVALLSAIQSASFNAEMTTGGSPIKEIIRQFDIPTSPNPDDTWPDRERASLCTSMYGVNTMIKVVEENFPNLFEITAPYFHNEHTVLDTVNMICTFIYQYMLRNAYCQYSETFLSELNRFAICLYDNLAYEFSCLANYRTQLMSTVSVTGANQ